MTQIKFPIKLSPSALNLFLDCPRCFWLEKVKGIKRPRGIFPSLPGGMDRIIKTYFDTFRAKSELPPELKGPEFVGVKLFSDQVQLNRWREWRTGLEFKDEDGSSLSGALDDLLVKEDRYIPFDYKTKGSPTTQEDATKYYQNQLDCYALMLEANQMKPLGHAFLLYFSPKLMNSGGNVAFEVQAIKIQINTDRARETIKQAVQLLMGTRPLLNSACEYCSFLSKFAIPQ
ncbi:MAG: PD-(D/E)XK nuclease family protein [Candidatus Omnitrophica bacterium]|nr:PD-(D/E)XK nuclease family protein [Candidatus Omnitrophota bacterium]